MVSGGSRYAMKRGEGDGRLSPIFDMEYRRQIANVVSLKLPMLNPLGA